jgi:hypothetical protein
MSERNTEMKSSGTGGKLSLSRSSRVVGSFNDERLRRRELALCAAYLSLKNRELQMEKQEPDKLTTQRIEAFSDGDVLQEFRITKMFAADGRRHAAIPKTVAMIRFWAMISPLLVPRSCPLRIMCITSKPLRVLQAVRKEPNPKQYLASRLTNR